MAGGRRQADFEWQAGSLFVIALNAWFQHFNGSGHQSARYIAFTSAPLMTNLLNDLEFIFDCPYVFRNRFDGESDYFNGEGAYYGDSVKEGGTQIEYEDEDPKIRQLFETELAKRGLQSRMT
jgi:hypothetical protein